MPAITIPRNEQGKVRVFSLSLTDDQAKMLGSEDPAPEQLSRALGLQEVNPAGIEVFRVSDLSGVGLAHYLTEGTGVVTEQVMRDRTKLSQLEGWVMVVRSAAFTERELTLNPMPALTLIGTYDEEGADNSVVDLESEAAMPYTGTPLTPPPPAPKGKAGNTLVVVALAVLVLLLLWWAFS